MFFFKGLQPQNVFIVFVFSMERSYLLTTKITADIYFLCFLKAVQKLGESLHVRRNFWYLVMSSTKLIHRYFNFLFEFPSLNIVLNLLIYCYNLVTLEKLGLIK